MSTAIVQVDIYTAREKQAMLQYQHVAQAFREVDAPAGVRVPASRRAQDEQSRRCVPRASRPQTLYHRLLTDFEVIDASALS
jgi:hypothetical protein